MPDAYPQREDKLPVELEKTIMKYVGKARKTRRRTKKVL
jgi:hypothetical protein